MIAKNRDRLLKITEYALIGVLALELLFLIYTNIFRLSDIIDVDFARVLRHVAEMGDKRTFFLPYWNYITTAELDHSAIFAIPLYILTGNLMLSYAIANLLNIALWAVVLLKLLKLTDLSRTYRLLAATFIFTLYDFGMLCYSNMLFIGAEHYTHKVLIPLMFITLLLTPSKERKSVSTISLAVLFFILHFITSISSGIYVFICGIFPVIIYMTVTLLLNGKGKDTVYRLIFSVNAIIVTLAGVIISKLNNVKSNSELAVIKSLPEIRSNLFSTFLDFMEMFRVFPEKSIPVMSLGTVMSVIRLFILVIVLFYGLRSMAKMFAPDPSEGAVLCAISAEQLLITVFLWNYLILFFSGSQQRYHILGAVPLMICAVIGISRFAEKPDKTGFNTMLLCIITGAILILNLYQVLWGSRQYFHREDYSKAVNGAVISFMEDNDVDTAFSVFESGYGTEWLRVADRTRVYETYVPTTGEVVNHDFYLSDMDRSAYSDRNVIIATEDEFAACPAYIKDNYELKGEAYNYNIYLSESNPIDGLSGMLNGMNTTDLPTAPGYETNGEIDKNGYLNSTESGDILISPEINITIPCILFINYSQDMEAESVVELYKDGSLVDTIVLKPENNAEQYDFPESGAYRFVVKKTGEGLLQIKGFEYNTCGK